MKKILSLLLVFAAACTGTTAAAQESEFSFADTPFAAFAAPAQSAQTTNVEVVGVNEWASDSDVRCFSILLKMTMQPGWHLYWKNPGEAGMPLSVEWKGVPADVTFIGWDWSTPKYYELQGLASYVYENIAYVEISFYVPKNIPAAKIALTGTASWLACDDNGCFPQDKEISVEIDLAKDLSSVEASPEFREAEKAFPFPLGPELLTSTFSEKSGAVEISLKRIDGVAFPANSRFFPESEKFEASAATVVPVAKNGTLVFELPLRSGEKIAGVEDLAGVLVAPDGSAIGVSGETFSSENATDIAAAGTLATQGDATSAEAPAEFSLDFAFLGLLLLAFAGGLILNLMPCVFPVLGLKIMHFVGKAGSDKKKIARHGFVFGAGVLISFWILAGALAVLRSGGEQLGWGFQLQEPGFVYGMILLMLVFGLSMSGVFEFGVGATSVGGSLTEKSGYAGSFFSGVLAVIIATPCAAPFLAPALGSALTLPLVPSFALFTAIAIGLAAPYVILSCVPALLKFLPKPGAWMETFKQAMAFLLYAPALYFVWVLMGQVEDAFTQRDLLLSLSVVALACWIYGKWATPWRSRFARIAGTLVALVLFAGTVFYALNLLYGKKSEDWITWSPEAQAEALDDGKIVYIDFTARWCATCQVNKRVYDDPELKKELEDANVVKMRADWTNKNATIAAELEKYGRAAVPVNVFLKEDKEPVILGELFSGPGTVSAGLQEITADE